MKKIVVTFVLLMLLSLSSAHAFFLQAYCQTFRTQAECRVQNLWGRPIACSGRMDARTYNGIVMNGWMNRVLIYPGQFAFMNAWTSNFNPFVFAHAGVNCVWY